jgi:hypothetical protein
MVAWTLPVICLVRVLRSCLGKKSSGRRAHRARLAPPPPRGALRLDGSWVPRKLRLGEGATCMKFGSSSRLVVSCSCSRLSSGFTYGSSSWEVGFAANYTSYHHRVSRGAATPWRNCNRARPQGHMDGTATPWQNGGLAAQPLLGAAR